MVPGPTSSRRGPWLHLAALAFLAACNAPAASDPDASSDLPRGHSPASALPKTIAAPEPSAPSTAPPEREIAGAMQILIAYKGAEAAPKTVTRAKPDAMKRAEEALAKVKDGKQTFEEIAKAYSDDPIAKASGGAIGNFERAAMPAPFADATFALKVGEVSDVVETKRGFYVIKRVR